MKQKDLIDGALTVSIFSVITTFIIVLVLSLSSCGSTQSVCPAYKERAKVERTKQHSRASDAKPRVTRGYVNCVGCR